MGSGGGTQNAEGSEGRRRPWHELGAARGDGAAARWRRSGDGALEEVGRWHAGGGRAASSGPCGVGGVDRRQDRIRVRGYKGHFTLVLCSSKQVKMSLSFTKSNIMLFSGNV